MRERVAFRCIGIHEAQTLLRSRAPLVLDIRDERSFAESHIEGTRQVSIATLSAVIEITARSAPILIYCYHGYASREYAQIFSDFGFLEVYSLEGGFEAWRSRACADGQAALDETLRQWLVAQGFPTDDLDASLHNGTTPLMKASRHGEMEIVRTLVDAGVRLDTKNADGNNALWLACVGSHLDVVDLLVETGIDIDNRNDNGATTLMYAASAGKVALVEHLLAHGADPTPETLDGSTALDMAATVECLALLLRATRASGRRAGAAVMAAK